MVGHISIRVCVILVMLCMGLLMGSLVLEVVHYGQAVAGRRPAMLALLVALVKHAVQPFR
jgi:hypothetical protein